MDGIIQLAIGIFIFYWGIYLLISSYKLLVLRQKTLILPVRWIIWIGRLLFGKAASDTYKDKQLHPNTLMVDGISDLITGIITLAMGIWLVIAAIEKLAK